MAAEPFDGSSPLDPGRYWLDDEGSAADHGGRGLRPHLANMNPTLPAPQIVRLPAHLESAVQRVRMAARSAAERTVDSLGLAALASNNVFQRDSLLGAQFELNRKLAIYALTFNETLDGRVAREVGVLEGTSSRSGITSWDALSLVDDHEVEIQVSADRFALEISHTCEWEIRELDAYISTVLKLGRNDPERNPLRAEVVGQAMIRAVEAVADRPDVAKVLATEIGRSLAHAMRETYIEIIAELRNAGVQPVGLSVRPQRHSAGRKASGHSGPGELSETIRDSGQGGRPAAGGHGLSESGRLTSRGGGEFASGSAGGHGAAGSASGGGFSSGGFGRGTPMGRVDGEMMSLIRRLSHGAPDWADSGSSGHVGGWGDGAGGASLMEADGGSSGAGRLMSPNLIVAHRDALRQAATGTLDHMVIDVIAGLFDQILSDPKVPPQMARQIGRLQLPVLRAALGDTSFFSSRKHPVRRFINRIATLGSAVEDFDSEEGLSLLMRVRELVQEVIEGEFDQVEVYEQKLTALEAFIAEQAKARIQADGAADQLLARKENQLRVQQRYAQQLDGALHALPVPEFLRQFLGQTWSRAIASAELEGGADSELVKRMRDVGRELVMSVQPKGLPAQRANFLRQLPQLMKSLNAGLDRIQCPNATRQAFFGALLPAHAESLKGQALTTLDHNLLARQVDTALATPVPSIASLPALTGMAAPVAEDALHANVFSPAEAAAVGLMDEASVDWNGRIDVDLGAEPEVKVNEIGFAGLPQPDEVEPMRGKSLADHVQIGFAYQMNVEGTWTKVRLSHISAGRGFFVFTHGAKQRQTISMTHRMLTRLCESGRLRAFENAYLIERATARARRQLAQLKPGA